MIAPFPYFGGKRTIAETVWRGVAEPVAADVEAWAKENPTARIILCGHRGDYDLPGWSTHEWDRGRATYSGQKTTAEECLWLRRHACRSSNSR